MVVNPGLLEMSPPAAPSRDGTAGAGAPDATPGASGRPLATVDYLYLAGRPSMRDFIRYVRGHAVVPPSDGALADMWRVSADVIAELERTEGGRADHPPMARLGPSYEPLLTDLLRDPLIRHGFNAVPTDIVLVELDRLVVHQKHIDVTFASELAGRIGPDPDAEAVFRTCLPFDHPMPPAQWMRSRSGTFTFVSPSNDLRYLGVMPLDPCNLADCVPPGTLVGVVGVCVGFGSNFLNATFTSGRLILNNGSHRAYALRSLGVTHAPCIVQHAATREELRLVADSSVTARPEVFLTSARPPMLRDYFDPRLFAPVASRRRQQLVQVTFETTAMSLPAV